MCGVLGIISHSPIAQEMFDGLTTLQHRGQDACGMISYDGKFHIRKNLGLVRDVFHTRHMRELKGNVAIGHTRYSTIGGGGANDAQPFLGQAPFGVMIAHNGNLFNSPALEKEIREKDRRLVNSNCDAEIILHIFTKALTKALRENEGNGFKPEYIWKAVESVYKRAKGAYSVLLYIADHGIIAFRDPHGIRPLLFGKRMKGLQPDYIFSSESIALNLLGFEMVRDVGNGEAIFIDEKTRKVHSKVIKAKTAAPCIFEHIYFARPDSVLDQISVYKARLRMGKAVARQIKKTKLDIDVVMPVPDSSRTAALAIAEELKLKYREGLIKNRYIGRTFIMPGQEVRKKSIRYKLNPMKMEIEGKKILLIDDSIVRGNTSKKIIQIMRDAGAKKIYFVSYAPPVTFPCLYGIDVPTRRELIGHGNTIEDIRKSIGADKLFYGDLEECKKACLTGNPKLKEMCTACFNGHYITGDIDEEVLRQNAENRRLQRSGACDSREDDEAEEADKEQMNLV